MRNILKEIEGKYPVDTILVDGEQVWPYLRVAYYFQYASKVSSQEGERALSPRLSFVGKLKRLPNIAYGMRNWFGKYDYIAISTADARKFIDGKYANRLLDPVIDKLGGGRVLYIEIPAPSLCPIGRIYTDKVVCYDTLELLAIIAQVFRLRRYRIENESILANTNKEYGLSVDYLSVIKRFRARRMVFKWLFRIKRPKAILLSWYYGLLQSAIKAADDLGIKVIEFQHGSIGEEHPAYNAYAELDKSYFPDYLAVFGKREVETFRNARFIEPQHVYPVGNFYIEHIRNNYSPESGFVEKLKDYSRTVGITLQGTTEKRTIEFAVQAANLDSGIFYILIPRRPQEEHYSTVSLPDNVTVIRDKNFYELMAYVDFHSTVYSTCAVEAPSLGVQNILINIDNLSKRYYGTVLTDGRVTRYADTPQEFVSTANSFQKLDRDTIVKLNGDLIAVDYERNIEELLRRPPFVE